jgi:hypothetical protein
MYTTITEGNTSYMLGATHLLNIGKLQLFARSFLQICKMQTQTYDLYSLMLVQVCLLSEFRQGQYMSSSHAAQWSKDMYDKSMQMEGHAVLSKKICEDEDSTHITKDGKVTLQGHASDVIPHAGFFFLVLIIFVLPAHDHYIYCT